MQALWVMRSRLSDARAHCGNVSPNNGEAAPCFGLRRLVLHDVPMLCETSSLNAKDIDDDPGRPPTSLEAPVGHDVVALGND